MKPLDKYRFNKKLVGIGKLSWDGLIYLSKLVLFLFFLITALTFWQNMVVELYSEYQINIVNQVSQMFLLVLILVILIVIDILIKNLKIRK